MHRTGRAIVFALAFLWSLAAAPAATADDDMREEIRAIVQAEMQAEGGLRAYWDSGLRLSSADGSHRIHIGGRLQLDAAFLDGDELEDRGASSEDFDDGVEVRRLWLNTCGWIDDHVEYGLRLTFVPSPNRVALLDVFVGLRDMEDCFGCLMPDLRIGSQRMPVGMEALMSSICMTFMQRAAVMEAFAPSYKVGVLVHDSLRGDQLTYALAYWAPGSSPTEPDFDFDEGEAFGGRLTWTPWYDCDCACRRLHLGVSYAAYSGLSGRRFRAHAATHQANRFADTGTIGDVDAYTTLGLELGLVYGPWSVQAEYILADVDSAAADDPQLSGGYAYVSYWLTGECRPYSRGLFGRPKPCCNFLDNECCCRGALELKARYEFLDLDDGGIDGGELSAITLGVNWHLNPNTRLMFEWFRAEYEGTPAGYDADPDVAGIQTVTFDDDVVSGVQMRFQVDF